MALILIADASAEERQRLRQIVETQDHVVVEADSGAYCLEIAEYHHPQGVVLNLAISGEEDLDLVRSLQALAVTTVAMAQGNSPDTHQACLDLGVAQVLPPHPEKAELLTSLAAALDGKSPQSLTNTQPAQTAAQTAAQTQPSAPPSAPNTSTQTGKVEALQQLLSIDKLQSLIGLGSNTASETLTDLTGGSINFQSPAVETMTAKSLQQLLKGRFGSDPICAVQLPFVGGLNGTAQLFFPQTSASGLTAMLTGEEPDSEEFATLRQEALTEVGNIVLNSVMGAMSNALTETLTYSVPLYQEAPIEELTETLTTDFSDVILLAQNHFQIEDMQVSGDIILFFKMQLFFDLVERNLA